ncbi:hypothetical protein DL89DRAFT_268056, partial [Linderina pennispora]
MKWTLAIITLSYVASGLIVKLDCLPCPNPDQCKKGECWVPIPPGVKNMDTSPLASNENHETHG